MVCFLPGKLPNTRSFAGTMEWVPDENLPALVATSKKHANQAIECLDGAMKVLYQNPPTNAPPDSADVPATMPPMLNSNEPKRLLQCLRSNLDTILDVHEEMETELGLQGCHTDAMGRLSTENTYLKKTLINEQRRLALAYASLSDMSSRCISLESRLAARPTITKPASAMESKKRLKSETTAPRRASNAVAGASSSSSSAKKPRKPGRPPKSSSIAINGQSNAGGDDDEVRFNLI